MFEYTMQPLKDEYKRDRWTFAALSAATSISPACLCDMFKGKYPPRVDNLMLICTALGVHPRHLFSRKEAKKSCKDAEK